LEVAVQTECYTCARPFERFEYDGILCPVCMKHWAKPVVIKAKPVPPPPPRPYGVADVMSACTLYIHVENGTRKLACKGDCRAHNCSTEHGCFCP
jgi:hypothetical protein